jgi:hypothetical protein
MTTPKTTYVPFLVLVLAACASGSEPIAPNAETASRVEASRARGDDSDRDSDSDRNGVVIIASGSGSVDLTTANAGYAKFQFVARRKADGTVSGHFRQSRMRNGLLVEFEGRVTCVTTDPAFPGRARIGGVVTVNNSTDPAFLTENHQVGDDVWFRVTDGGRGFDAVDASTTYGFKPTLVETSEQYCALPFTGSTVWNPGSIFPLQRGSIRVRG